MGKGQVGALLIVAAILASVFVIIATTTTTEDVPSVQHSTLDGLAGVRSGISQAILDWLREGPIDSDLACNGVYPIEEDALTRGFEPYLAQALESELGGTSEVEITPGILKGLEFEGLDGFTVILENGSIVYDDGTIYAEDLYDQEYFFNVRLPLALQVVQDWLVCDAGNLSLRLAEEFGEECFFGLKDNRYPGGCIQPKRQFDVEEFDREYMRQRGITPSKISGAVAGALEELNGYFAGEDSCREPALAEDSGISCTFKLEEVEIDHEMRPWSSPKIAVLEDVATRTVSKGQLIAMGEYLDFQDFVRYEDHVFSLPGTIETARWTDDALSCFPSEREETLSEIDSDELFVEEDRVDMITGEMEVFASPVLYVNTTRGAKFRINVRCIDERATLLGQPLEYSFSLRHGIRQHCGPDKMKNGNFMCSGCGLKPGIDQQGCKTFSVPSCGTAIQECSYNTVWLHTINTPGVGVWRGGYEATINDPENLALVEEINASCGAVWGMFDRYPPPRDEEGNIVCSSAQATVCCATPGYNDTCDPSRSFDNPDCYYNLEDYLSLCTQQKSCGEKTCGKYICNEGTANEDGEIFSCLLDESLPDGTSCRDDSGCFACLGGECVFEDAMEGESCRPPYNDRDTCRTPVCRKDAGDSGACITEPEEGSQGQSCTSGYVVSNPCSQPVCDAEGFCRPNEREGSDGTICKSPETVDKGDEVCTYDYFCSDGLCLREGEGECTPKEGGENCDPPCVLGGDGTCQCP